MNICKLGIWALFCLNVQIVFGQNEEDALRYAQQATPASARSWGMGGAMGALGADLSSFFINPAGIGVYKRGSMELSLALTDVRTNASYNGQSQDDFATRLELNNFGVVGGQKQNEKGLTFNFGVAYAKTNQFAQRIDLRSEVSNSSILDVFANQAGNINYQDIESTFPFTAGAAYAVGGIVLSGDSTFYVPGAQGDLQQSKSITRKGHQSVTAFAFGMGIQEKIYIGMALNFHGSKFKQNSNHLEQYGSEQPIASFTYSDDLISDGTGFSIRFGFLGKPTKWLRAGASVQSATTMTLREAWNVNANTSSPGQAFIAYNTSTLITDYNIRIPARYMGNMAFILGKMGVVTADYEYVNYNNIRMDGAGLNNTYNYALENSTIKNNYRGTHKVATGMEIRLPKQMYVRAGATYTQSPYFQNVADYPAIVAYHGGFGLRKDYWFMDLGIASYQTLQTIYPYDPQIASPGHVTNNIVRGVLGAGLRF
jgi:long-subunit fatty acid transport protein